MITKNFGKGKCLNGNKPNDDISTPVEISKMIIDMFDIQGTILDPFKGDGSFYNQYPDNVVKEWCEIKRSRPTNCKKVYLFDDNGNIVKEWVNAGECSNDLHIDRGNIRVCCISNTKHNYLYNSAKGHHLKYTKDTPVDMFEIEKDGIIKRFKSKNAFVDYFKKEFPDKKIVYGQLTRNRKTVYGYKIKVLNSLKKGRSI